MSAHESALSEMWNKRGERTAINLSIHISEEGNRLA